MEFEKTTIEGLLIIKPRIFSDERGYFYESYNQEKFNKRLLVSIEEHNCIGGLGSAISEVISNIDINSGGGRDTGFKKC